MENNLPINPEHLPAVIAALRAHKIDHAGVFRDSVVAYLNVGVGCGYGESIPDDPDTVECGVPECYYSPCRSLDTTWRALADATCGTCDGRGHVPNATDYWDEDCPDCCGTGKPIHTLNGDCWRCDGSGFRDSTVFPNGFECAVCTRTGSVSVDVVVAELLPVMNPESCRSKAPERCIEAWGERYGNENWLWESYDQLHAKAVTPLGPPLKAGDWIAVLKRVNQ